MGRPTAILVRGVRSTNRNSETRVRFELIRHIENAQLIDFIKGQNGQNG